MQLLNIAFVATVFGLALAPLGTFGLPFGGLVLLVAVPYLTWKRGNSHPLVLFFLFFLLANLRYPLAFPDRQDVDEIEALNKRVVVTATVTQVESLADGRTRADLRVTGVSLRDEALPLSAPFQIRLYIGAGNIFLLPGDEIRLRSRLRKPRLFGTPGEFNWPRQLAGQGIAMTAWIKHTDEIEVLGNKTNSLLRCLYAWKGRVATLITSIMPTADAALVRSLVLGEGRVMPDQERDVLASAGISHLFAISGLHLGLIGWGLFSLFSRLYHSSPRLLSWRPPQRVLPYFLVPILFGYLMLTGDAVATRRAFALVVLGATFLSMRYHINALQLLVSLAFLSLLLNPLLLWQAGWQLSFAGAAGIVFWHPRFSKLCKGRSVLLRYPVQLLMVTGAATLATLPLVLLNFHLLAPAGLPANLVAVPMVALLALPIGLLGMAVLPFCQPVAEQLFIFDGFILNVLVRFSEWLIALPGLGSHMVFLSRLQYLSIGLLVAALCSVATQPARKTLLLSVALLSFAMGLWLVQRGGSAAPLTITMFSVGQGESLLLQNDHGQTVLIDGGGLYSERFDVGERLVAPALAELGVNRLDAIVLTHDHPDHRKGLEFVLDHFKVGEVWAAKPLANLNAAFAAAVQRNGGVFRVAESGWSELPFGLGTPLRVFSPAIGRLSENDSSLVVFCGLNPDNGLLLTGDLEAKGVGILLQEEFGPVSLLKLPHHGSRHSATRQLIARFRPAACFVSAGFRNSYHLPAQSLVNYLEEEGIPLFRTDLQGTVRASFASDGWHFSLWENGLFR
ncbi:DNA internalization-related competence protein ComEC/Rec2 [Pelobacter seleniigenes]|uniref:DNA internalization-related competence protein ComEC/Rec2 n=1 Tax=Pelobacter seleniigenes TaxID=407188 RepID=UPI0004A6DEF2|nr:DNA internalization-related competence protein ComEC/Rec2 [Pelobacter seleniigenes]